jgi:hypothetical protein
MDTYFGNNLRVGFQIDQSPSKLSGRCVVVCLREYPNSTAQSDLQVLRLKVAMGEISCEFQASSDVVGLRLSQPAALELDRDPEQIFFGGRHETAPLHRNVQQRQRKGIG